MAEYNSVSSFGGLIFSLGNVTPGQQPGTLKTNIGKNFIEREIPMRNKVDITLQISGIITGLSRTAGETLSTAIERDRAALIVLEDGFKHAYSDGKHSGNFAIVPRSLKWPDEAIRAPGEPYKFTISLIEWGT